MVSERHDALWSAFEREQGLSQEQLDLFKRYYNLLVEWNEKANLTAIEGLKQVITHHFKDSLSLSKFISMESITMSADVGTGGGFPGIPLKIKYPHLALVLIEVNHRKREFLRQVIADLGLERVEIYSLDWRTFIRKTTYPIDLFCARASLPPEELIRMFKPSSPYKNATLVYWASSLWKPVGKETPFITRQESYTVGLRTRALIFFGLQK